MPTEVPTGTIGVSSKASEPTSTGVPSEPSEVGMPSKASEPTATDVAELTPDERLSQIGDLLIQSIIKGDEDSKRNKRYLFSQVPPTVFRNEDYILSTVFRNFKEIVPDEEFLKIYLTRNVKLIKDSSRYIDEAVYNDLDDNSELGYVAGVIKHYNRLMTLPPLSIDDFKLNLEKYKQEYSNFELNQAYSRAKMVLYDGEQFGRKFYQGYDDSVALVKKTVADIDSVLNSTTGDGFIDSRVMGIDDTDAHAKPELLGDFDLVKELNEELTGYYTGMFYNIMAPTKGGKSKWCARTMHTIMMNGHNVSVWAHEGGYEAWWAQMRAIHYEYMYIRNKSDGERVAPVSQAMILYDRYPSPEVKELEAASRLDLFTNPNYGVMNMIDRPFKVETFIDEIETSVQLNNSKAVCIDYLQLIGWDSKNLSKPQAISRAYQELLAYCKKRNVMVISPAQFTQDFLREMSSTKEGTSHETRVAGGESSEIVRTPDVNIALYASTEDLQRGEMTIMSIPSRMSEPFPNIRIGVNLGTCVFSSLDN